ncbi:alanine racemase [Microbacterium kribbense]|uniref:Alanine racemase n=1 Tax=Microbacterium kribbense TaxID=433645 RepID=A0ABP7GQ89_9MICO
MARFEVDLTAFATNLVTIRTTVAPAVHMLVVKDDAYGHGLAAIVPAARVGGVRWFGTFDVATAVAVRALTGPAPRIVAWTVYNAGEIDLALAHDIDLGLGTHELITATAAVGARTGHAARVHLKVDTGLHRNGIRPEGWAAAVAAAEHAQRAGALSIEGVWSHIAEASDEADDRARDEFFTAVDAFEQAPPLRHLAASAAAFARPGFQLDLVRIGAFAYGIRPSDGPSDAELGIRPIGTLIASVTDVATDAVTVDVGSLDGLDSRLAGRLQVGTPAGPRPVTAIGPVSAQVAAWPGAAVGDDVALFGGRAPASATDVAEMLHTIGEEVVLRISPRLPRRYLSAAA